MSEKMESYFAPAERATKEKLDLTIEILSNNPLISALLALISGLLAVLNEQRQIITVNDIFLQTLGYDDLLQVLTLRPGEAVQCIHAAGEPAGCGTTKYCETCGAAIAMVSSLENNQPVEKLCALSASRNGKPVNLALLVRSHPIQLEGERFLLLFIQDITLHEQRAALERTFFHDINNMLHMLTSASELLTMKNPSDLAQTIHEATGRLIKEVNIQRSLSQSTTSTYQPSWQTYTAGQIFADTQAFFANHPAAKNKSIILNVNYPEATLRTDLSLLSRVLYNMIINGLEATAQGGAVKVWFEQNAETVSFNVWNRQEISAANALRIFQRNFSTKGEAGRGVGTYSMKLFGEEILAGKVSFATSAEGGTVFQLLLPRC